MKKIFSFIAILILSLCYFTVGIVKTANYSFATIDAINVEAKSAYMIDYRTKMPIICKNENQKLPIASMTKLATLAVVFDEINKGNLSEEEFVTVSQNAADTEGSSAFLDAHAKYKVKDLIKTIVVVSANDSCVALAEKISGDEKLFAGKMNAFAKSLNLVNTNFENSTGLPSSNHYSTAKDIVEIYLTVCENKLYKEYSKIWMEDFIHPSGRKTGLVNTNRLIKTFDGIEGGKTGYTDASKFCLTASASRGTTRLIGVIIGAGDSKTRFAEMTTMLSYGFSNFESKMIVNSEIPITITGVAKSNETVEVYPERNCQIFTQKGDENIFTTDFKLDEIFAPVKSGFIVGKLFVFDKNNMVVDEINLIVKKDIERENFKEILNRIIGAW